MIICKRCGHPIGNHNDKSIRKICAAAPTDPQRLREAQHKVLSVMMKNRKRGPRVVQ